jgi:uncharacterized OB-fold protein
MSQTVHGELPVRFRYTPGVANTAFLEALRDHGVLLGARCDACGVTYLPARIFCERCFAELAPDTECGPGGTVDSFTAGHVGIDDEPLGDPMAVGLIRLDRADTVLMHRLLGIDEPTVGLRVRAVLRPAERRTGSILDLEGFEPESG